MFELCANYLDPNLCALTCLKEYIHRRNDRVDKEQKRLFITYRKPYHKLQQTLSGDGSRKHWHKLI